MQGVPPCHVLMSRRIAQPAGIGQTVDIFIQWGSSASEGMGSREFWVPGTNRMAPSSGPHAVVLKSTINCEHGRSRMLSRPDGS